MKAMISALLLGAVLLAFHGLVKAGPPQYYEGRKVGSHLFTQAGSWDEVNGWFYKRIEAWDDQDLWGNYTGSGFSIQENGYSAELGESYWRVLSCNVDRVTLKIGPAAATATFDAYVADLGNCYTDYFNSEPFPFTELDVTVTLRAPWISRKENISGTDYGEYSNDMYTCRKTEGGSYSSVAVTVNGETWIPPEAELSYVSEAFNNACNYNEK